MTQPNITPEGFRTAAYLATKARLDVARSRTGKTRKQVTCTPPNVKCGGRCIPPNWDCRLKGQGADPQLRAVQTDPVGGLANIERGVKRIGKGIAKGSFSEIEGGKRAIVRGVVKATPGDIQRKKELAAKLERRAGGIAAALAVVGFGLFSHNQLKRAPFYRDGVGRQIDDAVAGGINRILDVTPGIRGARAERRAAGAAAAGAAVARAAGEAARGPEALRAGLLRTPGQLERRGIEYGNANVLKNRLAEVDATGGTNAETWRQKSLEAFWSASRTHAGGAGAGSTFSEPATHAFLSQQFGFRIPPGADATQVRRSLATALSREATNLQALARQEKVDLKDADARSRFLNRLVGPSTENFPADVREKAIRNLEKILGDAPTRKAAAVSRVQLARDMYSETRNGFDKYFQRVADEVRQTPGAALSTSERRAGYGDLQNSARIGHSRYLARRLSKPESVTSRMGQGLSDAVAQEYFARTVNQSSTFTLSDRVTRAAASELAGRDITSLNEATQYLQRNGFAKLTPVQRPAGAPPPRGRRGTQAQITERAQALRAAAQARGEEMSLEAAYRAARAEVTRSSNPSSSTSSPRRASQLSEEELMRNAPPGVDARAWARRMMRGDALPPGLIRTATYLAVRADLRGEGKPCGASHIPKAHKCTKGAGATERKERELYEKSATKAEREYVEKHGIPKDTLSLVEAQLALEKETKQNKATVNKAAKIAIGVGVAAVGALAVTAALDAHRFLKPRDLPAPTSFKSVVQTQRKQAGTRLTSGEALGRHYDAEVNAGRLKAGDVVYTVQNIRGDASSGRHFAVYLGKTGENHQFLEMTRVRGDLNRGQAMLTEFGATAGRPAYAAVYAKAPGMKQDKQISINEIKNRAYSLMGSEMQYHQLDSNCETFARMIAAGNPRSRQVDKLSLLTKSIYRGLDRYLDEDRPVNLPTIKEQARILDYKQRVAEGDREARQELKAFTTLIAKRKQRNDAVEDLFTDLPSPTELLRGSKSEVEDATRIKLYLMLLLTQSRALMKRATP